MDEHKENIYAKDVSLKMSNTRHEEDKVGVLALTFALNYSSKQQR